MTISGDGHTRYALVSGPEHPRQHLSIAQRRSHILSCSHLCGLAFPGPERGRDGRGWFLATWGLRGLGDRAASGTPPAPLPLDEQRGRPGRGLRLLPRVL